MLEVGYLELEAIISGMSGVPDRGLIRRRFKYLQRMGYPTGTNTGRGRRALLSLEQMLQVVVAFELMQVGASPTRAIRILRTNWPELRPALALGWLTGRKPALAPLRYLLVMNAGAFEDAGGSEDPHEPVAQPLRPILAMDLTVGLSPTGPVTRVVLDPARLVSHLVAQAGRGPSGLTEEGLDGCFAELWADTHDVDPEQWIADATRSDAMGAADARLIATAANG